MDRSSRGVGLLSFIDVLQTGKNARLRTSATGPAMARNVSQQVQLRERNDPVPLHPHFQNMLDDVSRVPVTEGNDRAGAGKD